MGSLSSSDRWPRIRPTLDREEPETSIPSSSPNAQFLIPTISLPCQVMSLGTLATADGRPALQTVPPGSFRWPSQSQS